MFSSSKWMIPVEVGAAMIIGANIGTTLTGILAAQGARSQAKRAAFSHLLFNLIGAIICIIFFKKIMSIVDITCKNFLGFEHSISANNSKLRGLITPWAMAVFHTYFNLFSAILFVIFIAPIEKLLVFWLPTKDSDKDLSELLLSKHVIETPEIALIEAEKILLNLCTSSKDMFNALSKMILQGDIEDIDKLYLIIKKAKDKNDRVSRELSAFLKELTLSNASKSSNEKILSFQNMIREIHNINRIMLRASLSTQTKEELYVEFKGSIQKSLKKMSKLVDEAFDITIINIQLNPKEVDMRLITENEERINEERDKLRIKHLERLEKNKDELEISLLLRSMYSSFEKIADHIYSINETIIESR